MEIKVVTVVRSRFGSYEWKCCPDKAEILQGLGTPLCERRDRSERRSFCARDGIKGRRWTG